MSIMVRKKMEGDVRKSVWIFLWMPECGNHGSYFSSYYGLKKRYHKMLQFVVCAVRIYIKFDVVNKHHRLSI